MKDYESHINAALLREVAEGSHEAFASLFNIMVPLLKPGILKLVRSEEVFREVVQECFLKVWLHRDQLPQIENPEGWIYRIAANECFNWLNREARLHKQMQELHLSQRNADLNPAGLDADRALGFKETEKLVQQAINALPERKRTIYSLSRVDGLKAIEIAEKMRLSHSYVRNAISESLGFIRECLREAGHMFLILPAVITPFA